MIWNCRGAGNATLYRYYKQCVDDNKPDMLVVLETRVDPRKLRHTFSILGYDGVDFVDGQGFAGRIIVAWRTHIWCRFKLFLNIFDSCI